MNTYSWKEEEIELPKEISPFSVSSAWYRFEKYKIIKNSRDISFLVPAQNAKPCIREDYDYHIHYPIILEEALELARHIQQSTDDDFTDRLINGFCNKYGLFNIPGLYFYYSGNLNDIKDYLLLTERGRSVFNQHGDRISIRECIDFFFPDNWAGTYTLLKQIMDSRSILAYILINNCYCEPIQYIKKELLDLYGRFDDHHRHLEKIKNDPSTIENINSFNFLLTTNPIKISAAYNEGWKFEWITNNLIDALGVMILENITQEKQEIRRCSNKETCNRYFIITNPRQEYCSKSCNNVARQRRFQQKKKNQKE